MDQKQKNKEKRKKRKKICQEDSVNDEKMTAELDEKLAKLQSKKQILQKHEENKTNPKYLQMILKVKTIENLGKEIKEKIEVILA